MRTPALVRVGAVAVLAGIAGGCDRGLTDINHDPNHPTSVDAKYLLPHAEAAAANTALGEQMTLKLGGLWAQSFSKIQYNDEDHYALRDTDINTYWNNFYANALADLEVVRAQGDSLHRPNYAAIATVMEQWTFQVMTDTWGDIPYSQALKGAAAPAPAYDPQKDIYYAMMDRLKAASAQFDPAGATFGGEDFVFAGDVPRWRRFSNSLRMRMAMRISAVDPAKAQAEFVDAYDAGPMTGNADDAAMHYDGANPSDNRFYNWFHEQGRNDQAVSKTMVDTLKELSDPRLAVYADRATVPDPTCGDYCGWQNGVGTPAVFGHVSAIGAAFKEDPKAPAYLMTYAEVLFLEAEAAAKGWIAGDPAALYQAAIRASMQQNGIADAATDAYLARPQTAYAGLRSIHLQKWIALYGNGPEQYAEWRRTHVPYLTPAPLSPVAQIPLRVTYPSREQSTNHDNWQAAVQRNGGGTLWDKPVWWNTAIAP